MNRASGMTDNKKLMTLKDILLRYQKIAVAFSGGVDSTFLLCFAEKILGKENVMAVTANAINFAPNEISFSKEYAKALNIRHIILDVDMDVSFASQGVSPNYDMRSLFEANPSDRCYYCKRIIFSSLLSSPEVSGYMLCDGTNADDVNDYRPGLKALSELSVKSPLLQAGLTKSEIRCFSKELGVPIWDKPAFACLASRVPYGEPITAEKLNAIYSLEELLKSHGFLQCRARHHNDIARIEVMPDDMVKLISDAKFCAELNRLAKDVGFKFCALDIAGYKMGNMN